MLVKNFTTNNKDLIIESIIKELCKNNISYVFIKESNELHFKDYIFRFYENFYIYSRIEAPISKIKEKNKEKKIIPKKILMKTIPNQQNYPNKYL